MQSSHHLAADRLVDAGQEHRELVTADARDEILFTQHSDHDGRNGPQKLVAEVVSPRLVRELDAVDVEDDDGCRHRLLDSGHVGACDDVVPARAVR